MASQDSIGVNGINSSNLVQTGNGVDIGQVELGRPGDPNFDTNNALFNSTVEPNAVFWRHSVGSGFSPGMDVGSETSAHAVEVASVMISTDTVATGVATEADLFSVGINPVAPLADIYEQTALSANHLATLSGQDLQAINMSINVSSGASNADGTSLLTSFVDWSARTHDILYVTAGFETGGSGPLPSDNFNGITVGYTEKSGGIVYNRVDGGNDFTADDFGERTFVDLVAPGRNIQLATQGDVITTIPDPVRAGTSLAAPHVTGTVALLQEFADNQITTVGAPRWDADARHHEVMKAVLMNSADKLEDTGDGNLLGMTRTVLKQNGTDTWLTSAAAMDTAIPLDEEFGAGHLNARRALKQFSSGEWDPNSGDVPVIGWDFDTTNSVNSIGRYPIGPALRAGSRISMTLAWDRLVEFDIDGGTPGVFDVGDTFETYGMNLDEQMNDLDLFLVDRGTLDVVPGGFSAGEVNFVSTSTSGRHWCDWPPPAFGSTAVCQKTVAKGLPNRENAG